MAIDQDGGQIVWFSVEGFLRTLAIYASQFVIVIPHYK